MWTRTKAVSCTGFGRLLVVLGALLVAPLVAAQNTQLPAAPLGPATCDPDHPDLESGIEVISQSAVDPRPYAATVKRRIRDAWYSLVGSDLWMKKACAVVEFNVRADGGVASIRLARSSGDLQLDRAALAGIISPAPYAALPAGASPAGLLFRFRFYYNPSTDNRAGAVDSPARGRMTAPDDEPLSKAKDLVLPVVIYSPDSGSVPVILDQAANDASSQRKGRVLLTTVVTSKGDAVSVKITHSEGNGFDEKAMAAVLMSKFRPATSDGVAVRAEANIRVDVQ